MSRLWILAALATAVACSRPIVAARTTALAPPHPIELDAADRVATRRCTPRLGFLFPGLGQMCLRQDGRAALLAGLASAEIGTAVAVAVNDSERAMDRRGGDAHPGVGLPLVALQDLWLYGVSDVYVQESLARRQLYAPRDSLVDLVAAPFNAQVMRQPWVWGGLLGTLALGVGATFLIDEPDASRAGDDPDLFGRRLDGEIGYPLGFGVGGVLFGHVAIAEEAFFRGFLQSRFARDADELSGWAGATLVFGLAHVPNAFLLPEEDRRDYLLYAIPLITAAGGYLGWVYRATGYSLASPVAIHFWYDLLLTTTFFVVDPESLPFKAGISIPF